jgi:hypothetical protein
MRFTNLYIARLSLIVSSIMAGAKLPFGNCRMSPAFTHCARSHERRVRRCRHRRNSVGAMSRDDLRGSNGKTMSAFAPKFSVHVAGNDIHVAGNDIW